MAGIKRATVIKWIEDLDPRKSWIKYEESGKTVTSISCEVCARHVQRLKGLRNFSQSFIQGVSGTALKKDNILKHSKSEMHRTAVNIDHGKSSLHSFFTKTEIGASFSNSMDGEKQKVKKLFDIAYVFAKEEIAFRKFQAFVSLEKRHGVEFVNAYATNEKCKEFTECIGAELKGTLVEQLITAEYFSILIDGATDNAATEKEAVYVLFVDSEGNVKCSFLGLEVVQVGTAAGLKEMLCIFFYKSRNCKLRIKDYRFHGGWCKRQPWETTWVSNPVKTRVSLVSSNPLPKPSFRADR